MCLTGNGDVPHLECIPSSGMGMCLTGNGDVPHRECISSPGMRICLTGNAHSLYRVLLLNIYSKTTNQIKECQVLKRSLSKKHNFENSPGLCIMIPKRLWKAKFTTIR